MNPFPLSKNVISSIENNPAFLMSGGVETIKYPDVLFRSLSDTISFLFPNSSRSYVGSNYMFSTSTGTSGCSFYLLRHHLFTYEILWTVGVQKDTMHPGWGSAEWLSDVSLECYRERLWRDLRHQKNLLLPKTSRFFWTSQEYRKHSREASSGL